MNNPFKTISVPPTDIIEKSSFQMSEKFVTEKNKTTVTNSMLSPVGIDFVNITKKLFSSIGIFHHLCVRCWRKKELAYFNIKGYFSMGDGHFPPPLC